jgi:hypothetical protein
VDFYKSKGLGGSRHARTEGGRRLAELALGREMAERRYSASIQRASVKSFGVSPPSECVHTEIVTSL